MILKVIIIVIAVILEDLNQIFLLFISLSDCIMLIIILCIKI